MVSFLMGFLMLLQVKVAQPIDAITPGKILTTNVKTVCTPGYTTTVRHSISKKERALELKLYGYPVGTTGLVIDHRVPLEEGGADVRENRWPQPKAESVKKDQIENAVHARVCSGKMTIQEAQKRFMKDWTTAGR
jgi:hypothetical protein